MVRWVPSFPGNPRCIEFYLYRDSHSCGFFQRSVFLQDIYLSDMHDENVLRTPDGHICVIDSDIRINIPELRTGGTRKLINKVEIIK